MVRHCLVYLLFNLLETYFSFSNTTRSNKDSGIGAIFSHVYLWSLYWNSDN